MIPRFCQIWSRQLSKKKKKWSRNMDGHCAIALHFTCDYAERHDIPLPGLKRKFRYDCGMVGEELSDMHIQDSLELNWSPYTKRRIYSASSSVCDGDRFPSNPSDDGMDVMKHSSTLGSRSPCAIKGCFSMGLSRMFAGHHHLWIERV